MSELNKESSLIEMTTVVVLVIIIVACFAFGGKDLAALFLKM
jgi:hypothetical protein